MKFFLQRATMVAFFQILSLAVFGQNWTTIQSGTTKDIETVFFVSEEEGWIAGEDGFVRHTTDGGLTWQSQFSMVGEDIYASYFIDELTGWMVGKEGSIIHTNDGGFTWTSQFSGTSNSLHSIGFANSNVGFAVGEGAVILKTTDGGETWNINFAGTGLGGSSGSGSGGGADLYSVQVINSNTVYTCGQSGLFMKTTNGGSTWNTHTTNIVEDLTSMHFPSASNGYIAYELGKVKNTNGVGTFTSVYAPTSKDLNAVWFVNGNKGWVAGEEGRILYTTNGGVNWFNQTSTLITRDLYALHFPSESVGYCSGKDGFLMKLTNAQLVSTNDIELIEANTFIYPNPASTQLNISLAGIDSFYGENVQLTITDSYGKVCLQKMVYNQSSFVQLNVQGLAQGMYHLQLLADHKLLTSRFIKQ